MKMKLKVIKHSELPLCNTWHLSPVCLRVVIKIAGVAVIAHFRDYGGLQLLVVDLFPVNRLEPSGKKLFIGKSGFLNVWIEIISDIQYM